MGFRYHFASISKKDLETVKFLSIKQINKLEDKKYNKEIFDFGGNDELYNIIEPLSEDLFKKNTTKEYFLENKVRICNQETFLAVIEYYRKNITDYFISILNDEAELKLACTTKINEWENLSTTLGFSSVSERTKQANKEHYPFNLDLSRDTLVNSWLNEYQVFELVRIYREFDWDNNALLFYGW